MKIAILILCASALSAQEFNPNFDTMLVEVNRSRFDKALVQLFPVQNEIRLQLKNKFPPLDAGLRGRIKEMANASAVLSTVALLRARMTARDYEDANAQAFLLGIGLSGLWATVPAYRKLDYARQDYSDTPDANTLRLLGYAAIDALEWATARKASAALLANPKASRQSALTIRGLAELGQGQTAAAEKTLLESAKLPAGAAGPNLRLVRALFDLNKRAAVDQFLALLEQSVWAQSSKATDWRKDLAAGRTPDFGFLNPTN